VGWRWWHWHFASVFTTVTCSICDSVTATADTTVPIMRRNFMGSDLKSKLAGSWRRFGLRVLLTAVAIVAMFFGWLSYELRRAHVEQEAVRNVLTGGGYAYYECSSIDPYGQSQGCSDSVFRSWLRRAFGDQLFGRIKGVSCGPHTNAMTLSRLSALSELQSVGLFDTNVDSDMISQLSELPVSNLKLYRCSFSQGAYSQLRNLSQLEAIAIVPLSMEGVALEVLQGMPRLWSVKVELQPSN
jgi:hypothetical protein